MAGSAGGPGLFYATPEPAPLAFPALTPTGGMPYALGVALSDDLVNQSLARLAAAGGLEIATSGDLANGLIQPRPVPATPASSPASGSSCSTRRLQVAGPRPGGRADRPLRRDRRRRPRGLRPHRGGGGRAPHLGYWAPIARLGLRGSLGLDLDLDLFAGTIGFLPGTAAITLDARSSLAGLEIASAVANYGPALSSSTRCSRGRSRRSRCRRSRWAR
ncbi:MAG: hypothetical protein R3F20_16235 [Planctomycetota bacterium]